MAFVHTASHECKGGERQLGSQVSIRTVLANKTSASSIDDVRVIPASVRMRSTISVSDTCKQASEWLRRETACTCAEGPLVSRKLTFIWQP